ncbi:MAG: sodium-translocating pyrophosphatase [Dehalococcoidia bacterium]|nr:sodium-translocating pyrophosphatase [Dehalococcoidia bacterium]
MGSLSIGVVAGTVGLLFALAMTANVLRQPQGSPAMREIARAIQEGASAFLRREYLYIAVFVAVIVVVLWVFVDADVLDKMPDRVTSEGIPATALTYLAGAFCSALTGLIGMNVAVRANVRTAAAAERGLDAALRVAFSSGAVMGITVVGIGILGISLFWWGWKDPSIIAAFGMGASTIALFARVGGGIFTKAADVGADLVGKVEKGIPEDDPRNPAVIADNVGDNVGDVAGMGADLFESYVGSIIAAIALAATSGMDAMTTSGGHVLSGTADTSYNAPVMVLPILVAAIGIFSSLIGTFLVRTGEDAGMGRLLWALRTGIFASGALILVGAGIAIPILGLDFRLWWVVLVGLVAGQIIGTATEYYTSYEYRPTKQLARQTLTGPATTIIGGMGLGMLSTLVPIVTLVVAIWFAHWLGGVYGIALAAVGMLSTLGITLATDAYGPVADNAGGIAQQANLPPVVRQRTDALDSLGNTTAATGKGFAVGSAVLTALALMAAYVAVVNSVDPTGDIRFDLRDVPTLLGLLVGALLPFLFCALAMQAVGRAAFSIVNEVRRQFKEIPGLMEGTARPEYARCVDISTRGALREMVLPGTLAIVAPVAVGAALGPGALGGLLIGSIGTGALLAIMMANAGGAWDNAKKFIESGEHGGKGSDAHKAAVVGDTVGDPFKDTAGPSLNILLKLMAIVALVFGPLFL